MNGVGDEQGDFASGVEDVFLAGFEAWGELAQMQGPLLGTGGGQVGGVSSPAGNMVGVGGRSAPGIGSMTGLGGSMQSFLGEAGMYPDSSGSGVESFKDGSYHNNVGSSSNNDSSNKQFGGGESRDHVDPCKMEDMEQHNNHNNRQEDDFCSDEEEEEHDYHANEDGGAGSDDPQAESVRGLGRIFGIGTHPVVAEAQARAEALVHGRGGKSGGSAVDAAEKKRKRAVLSKEERAKQNRDRNREHARNTRLRKKAFVEELKKQVEELVAGRDREERDRRAELRRESSLRDMRLQVLLTFLEYRGRAESGRQEWCGVLDDNFEMRMPITPYRAFPPHQVQGGMRVIKGVDGVLADTASLSAATKAASSSGRTTRHDNIVSPSSSSSEGKGAGIAVRIKREASGANRAFMASRGGMTSSESCSEGDQTAGVLVGGGGGGGGKESPAASGAPAASAAAVVVGSAAGVVPSPNRVYYVVDPKEVVHSKNAFMCPVLARSPQLLVPGMLRCSFSTKSNRLSSLQFSFDPTVPARQLARASMMQGRSSPGMTGMMAGMLEMGGVEASAAIGQSADAVGSRPLPTAGSRSASQGAAAGRDEGVLHSVLEDIREGRVSSTLVDDPKEGKSYLRVYPLNEETPGVTHFFGVLESLRSVQVSGGTEAPTAMAIDPNGVSDLPAGEELSSALEAGTSEGETSSDSASSTTRGRVVDSISTGGGSSGSGSGGSDDGAESRSARSSRMTSTGTTTASDGGASSASGYETRRSSRRHASKDKDANASSPTGSTTTVTGGNGTTSSRGRVRPDGSKRARV